ncbi:MAG: acyltransferase family protein [Alphaproteobacteria bacterium]
MSRLLSSKLLVAIGLVSYSAYLWHWPLVAFHRYSWGAPHGPSRLAIGVLTAGLAWASWRWVEQPARRSNASLPRVLLRQWALPSVPIAVLAAWSIATGGLGPRALSQEYSADLARLRESGRMAGHAGLACDRKRLSERDMADPHCLLGPPDAPGGVVLWGDSHAAHWVGLLDGFARAGGFRFRNFDAYACAPVSGDPAPFVSADRLDDCVASQRVALPALREAKVVILAGAWPRYGARRPFLDETLHLAGELAAEGRSVVLMGRVAKVPGWDGACREKALSNPWLQCPTERFEPLDPMVAPANERLREFARATPGVSYFDPNDVLCADPRGCTALSEDGEPLYFDESHLTLAGSRNVGEWILRERGLPEPFASMATDLRSAGAGAGEAVEPEDAVVP